ncbi:MULTISPECIES: xanthine dehydrogenase family protein molybdopterin-binding subunit [Alteromonas]|uniref:Xanthine dehydrogenase n=1 Tax=Alteromonas stellipolaris TaxID=233316 RepID=A0AAW7Z2J2_9ALTE|nr:MULTISPECIES: xanthine dehydrogenase family protein molybdopterin-binding subunit [Alteromonas]AMJ91146.1 xanthine dehydrogenase [Alteromonas sp. Mac2]ALM90090.1 Periplasmic aromatic aldehyde oxidoreductase, molybdenum binding subunit YagR [Alteromonas stellipolaris LMG 21856]AMJ74870.1 xanthine dehydrogenase [Alteromonas stellipolaris]AMJ87284.1 xanthine dehydrogenase [Alteromonas sp. Mac1]MDO6577275.1 xanthine dehydrogenase family protein molybdopterin-binding subunit [Alteromonas stellip
MKIDIAKNVLGKPISRVDGILKVTGQARYAAEQQFDEKPLIGWLVSSDTAIGEITKLSTDKAESAEGVHAVLTYKNAGPLKPFSKPASESRFTQSRAVLNEPHIRHFGAPVALVIADTLEQARYAASLVEYTIDAGTPDLLLSPDQATNVPDSLDGGFEADVESGNSDHDKNAVSVDADYTTPSQISAAMEPHATIANFDGDKLTVYTSVQIIASAVEALAVTFELDAENIEVKSPFVGGGFGSKLGLHYDAVLACLGARYLKRPVKVVLSRRQVFYNSPHRGNSFQSMQLSCNREGLLGDITHHSAMPRAKGYEFAEATGAGARVTYRAEHIKSTHRIKDADIPLIDSTRSPGDAIGSLAFESAIDELALKAGIDPLTFRIKNLPQVHPVSGKRFTTHRLGDCLQEGAQKFGWQHKAAPKKGKVIGHGVASAMRMNVLVPSAASISIDSAGKLVVRSDMTDIGTGSYTILAQIAAGAFHTQVDNVDVQLGDSSLPTSCGSGGSFGAASTGSALMKACELLKQSLKKALEKKLPNSIGELALEGDTLVVYVQDTHTSSEIESSKLDTHTEPQRFLLSELIDESDFPLTEIGEVSEDDTAEDEQYSCGAHFAEVEVDTHTGEVRLKRQYGIFSAGKILNEKTASSQIKGGMVWGAGYALTEAIHHHTDSASFINPDFGEYHIAVNRDIADVTLDFLETPDYEASPIGAKGIGELGITGAGAAIANAIADATGVRIREFPITMDKVMEGLMSQRES